MKEAIRLKAKGASKRMRIENLELRASLKTPKRKNRRVRELAPSLPPMGYALRFPA